MVAWHKSIMLTRPSIIPCCCTHTSGTWHLQNDQSVLKCCFTSQVMPYSVHTYVFGQAICTLLPKQLLFFCVFHDRSAQLWAINLSVCLISCTKSNCMFQMHLTQAVLCVCCRCGLLLLSKPGGGPVSSHTSPGATCSRPGRLQEFQPAQYSVSSEHRPDPGRVL